ncbi:PAS domain-containing protein [Rhodovibrio salinarum]|uniref:PAS domain-containing protein n=1 Tax=Rhodovibrio salinarum TaxID=1087 RepID=A0A934QGS9_9PROT|nr:PAS domain-containing protein [Rhodovibrio salinarum]MBK1696275.1 PAS domain-containing protein [Rhodovibrio salinarum]
MLEGDLKALVDLWQEIRDPDRKIPRRSAFDPMRLRSRLAQVHLLEFDGPACLIYRLSGTAEVARLGEDPKGKDCFTLVDAAAGDYLRCNMHALLFHPTGVLVTTEEIYADGTRTPTRYVALPLRDEARQRDQVISIVAATAGRQPTGVLSPQPSERPWYDYVMTVEPVDLGWGVPAIPTYRR